MTISCRQTPGSAYRMFFKRRVCKVHDALWARLELSRQRGPAALAAGEDDSYAKLVSAGRHRYGGKQASELTLVAR